MSTPNPAPDRPRGARRTGDPALSVARAGAVIAGTFYVWVRRPDGRLTLKPTGLRSPDPRMCCLLAPCRTRFRMALDTFGRTVLLAAS